MKQSLYHVILVTILTFSLISQCSCQSNSKQENSIQNEKRVFQKKPNLDTLLNHFAKPIGYVNDYGGLFTSDQVFDIDSIIYDFENKNSIQLIVVTFDSIMVNHSEVDEVTKLIGNGWKVGGDSGKGIVIGISKPHKMIRVQNGKFVQRLLSDYETKKIIDSAFIPEFRNDNYFKGTSLGIKGLMKTLLINLETKSKIEY